MGLFSTFSRRKVAVCLCLLIGITGYLCSSKFSSSGEQVETSISYPILSNRGYIESIFINECDANGNASVISSVADFFLKKEISVCLVRNILCWGTSVASANSCQNSIKINLNLIPDSYKVSGNRFVEDSLIYYISWLAPLDLRGVFTEVVSGIDTIDYSEMNPLDRLDFINKYQNTITSLVWNSTDTCWTSVGSKFKIIASEKEASFFNKFSSRDYPLAIAIEVDNRFEREFLNLEYGKATLNQENRKIPWDAICLGQRDKECIESITGELARWAQDEYHVRLNSDKLLRRRIPCVKNKSQLRSQIYANSLCSEGRANLDSLPIQGGNFFINENLIFVGRNDLICFKSCENWLSTMGLKVNASVSDISKALEDQISAKNPEARIIWIGDKQDTASVTALNCNKRLKLDDKYQPIFHIDLFFHPFGKIDRANPMDFYYITATLDSNFHKMNNWSEIQKSRFEVLRKRLLVTFELLKKDISKDGKTTPRPIEIPLLVDFDANEDINVVAFSNGISSNAVIGCSYFMPSYSWIGKPSSGYKNVKYNQALKTTMDSLTKTGLLEVDTVTGVYTGGALNCMVKVLKRTP